MSTVQDTVPTASVSPRQSGTLTRSTAGRDGISAQWTVDTKCRRGYQPDGPQPMYNTRSGSTRTAILGLATMNAWPVLGSTTGCQRMAVSRRLHPSRPCTNRSTRHTCPRRLSRCRHRECPYSGRRDPPTAEWPDLSNRASATAVCEGSCARREVTQSPHGRRPPTPAARPYAATRFSSPGKL